MVKVLIRKIIKKLEAITGFSILIFPQQQLNRLTSVKSDFGFWYTGNVFDINDIAYGIYRNGQVEANETKLVTSILTKLTATVESLHFYDIGANSGYYGILAAYLGKGKTKTYSFEPLHEYTSLIRETVALNALDESVRIFDTALGATETVASIQISGSGSSLVPGFLGEENKKPTREIQVATLDKTIEKENLPFPHFIKIDVEGFELDVLKGSIKTLTASRPVLFIEVARSLNTITGTFVSTTATQVFDLLASLGYEAYITSEIIEPITTASNNEGVFMYLFLNKNNPNHEMLKEYEANN